MRVNENFSKLEFTSWPTRCFVYTNREKTDCIYIR